MGKRPSECTKRLHCGSAHSTIVVLEFGIKGFQRFGASEAFRSHQARQRTHGSSTDRRIGFKPLSSMKEVFQELVGEAPVNGRNCREIAQEPKTSQPQHGAVVCHQHRDQLFQQTDGRLWQGRRDEGCQATCEQSELLNQHRFFGLGLLCLPFAAVLPTLPFVRTWRWWAQLVALQLCHEIQHLLQQPICWWFGCHEEVLSEFAAAIVSFEH
mmetsp:Transcript_56535/g.123603  ORF Transcript_56535/g.123603 Transcript_56535/m.123603 type:complete len:212 (-) Transcript_56535:379-1014(-)